MNDFFDLACAKVLDRRRFVIALASALAMPQSVASPPPLTVGVLFRGSESQASARIGSLRTALGAARSRSIAVRYDIRYAEGNSERLASHAKSLVATNPAVIVADSSYSILALRKESMAIPIVAASVDDPVASRFAAHVSAPGGSVTGILAGDVDELLAAVPLFSRMLHRETRISLLTNANNANHRKARSRFHHGAVAAGLMQHDYLDGFSVEQLIQALTRDAREARLGALVVMNDAMFLDERRRIVDLVSKLRIPALYPSREFVQTGGLMSFGPDVPKNWTRSAALVERILAGEIPAQVPFEPAGASELVLNEAEAKRLKLSFPEELRARARQ